VGERRESGEETAVVSQLSQDAGFEAVRLGDMSMAATQEGLAGTLFAIAQSGLGQFVYRMAPPEQL
jgi:predicted dinucleotide-binding enzyme